ncbi:MAG: hypothetical protein MI892_22605, partial [Desulfobacterales bacterium]|nr:hypothetical protein [Desulfobacterales bacterium]
SKVERVNDWILFYGEMKLLMGVLKCRDAYRIVDGMVQGQRRFTWSGKHPLELATLSVRFLTRGQGKGLFLPSVCYYGNPSGEKSGRTPVWHGKAGELAFFEEHRYPMPFAAMEWEKGGGYWGAALHSLPSTVPFANLKDQWWSLGAKATERGTELALLSGPCAANGQKGVIKAYQGKHQESSFAAYDEAYVTIPPGEVVEKSFWLEVYPVADKGGGFQRPVHSSLAIFKPVVDPSFPGLLDITQRKYNYAKTRWIEGQGYVGFNQFGTEMEYIVHGWVGQAAAPGYAMQVLRHELDDPDIPMMVQRSLDFVSTTRFHDQGFYTWYDVKNRKWGERLWRPDPELLSQGQGMYNLANAIRVGRKQRFNTKAWERFLKQAADFHAQRILKKDWQPKSTDEGFFIAPLCKAAELFKSQIYQQAARKAGDVYAQRHLSMEEPYWG